VKILEVDLFSPTWEVRHGAALALRELLKVQGKCGGMRGKDASDYNTPLFLLMHFQIIYLHGQIMPRTRNGVMILLPNFFAYSF
jgi:hypothetical protein